MEEEEAAPPSYYYSDAARGALGPCLLSQLRVLWVSGHISRDTSVWREGLGSWLPIHALPEVSNELLPLAHPSSHQVGSAQGPAEWYFLDADGQRSGAAHTVEQMGRLLASGELDGMSLVWREGMAEWLELGQVAVLRAAGQAATEPEDEPPPEQQVFDPYADLGPAQQARAGLNQRKKGGAAAAAVAAGAPAAAGSAAEDAATGGAGAEGDAKPKRVRKKKPKFKADGGANIYVSGLAEEVTEEELLECFKVAGLFKLDAETQRPKLKMYKDAAGRRKGDALLSFIKPESVTLAVTLRDGYELRPGRPITVAPAKFEQRGDALAQKRLGKEASQQRKRTKMVEQRALQEWDDELAGGAGNKTVVLTGLFSAEEAAAAPAGDDFYANLKQDIEVECKKAGELDKVFVFEASEKGAVMVKFKSPEDAQRCVAMMNERKFGGTQISCVFYDGVTDYRAREVREAAAHPTTESVDEQEKNLNDYADWLEAESTDEELAADEGDD